MPDLGGQPLYRAWHCRLIAQPKGRLSFRAWPQRSVCLLWLAFMACGSAWVLALGFQGFMVSYMDLGMLGLERIGMSIMIATIIRQYQVTIFNSKMKLEEMFKTFTNPKIYMYIF